MTWGICRHRQPGHLTECRRGDRSGWSAEALYSQDVLCQGLGAGLQQEIHQGDSLLDRGKGLSEVIRVIKCDYVVQVHLHRALQILDEVLHSMPVPVGDRRIRPQTHWALHCRYLHRLLRQTLNCMSRIFYWLHWERSNFIWSLLFEQSNCWTIVLVLWQEAKIILFTLSLRALKICQKLLNIEKICDSNWYVLLVL